MCWGGSAYKCIWPRCRYITQYVNIWMPSPTQQTSIFQKPKDSAPNQTWVPDLLKLESGPATLNHRATRTFKTCRTWLFSSGGTDFFSFRLSNNRNDNSQHNNSRPVTMNQNYTYFLSDWQNIHFLVCRRILIISLCVPWHEKGWRLLI